MANPEITICGRLSVVWDGQSLESELPGRQGRLIFAYMVLNRSRPVRRDALVEALWEGVPNGGDALLAPPLSRLRKALGPGRLEGRAELTLELGDDASIDWETAQEALVDAQQVLAEAGDPARAWSSALKAETILGGGLLPGLEARWIEEHRVMAEELRLKALEAVAKAGARLGPGELARAERAARAAVEASPFRESARAAQIEVMQAQGNIAEALRSYEELRILLREELGTFPSPELTTLHEQLLNAHEKPAAARDTRTLPRTGKAPSPARVGEQIDPRISAITLVGRSEIMEQLSEELEKASVGELRIALLAGEGGVGKTRLAAELAAGRDDIAVLYGRCEPDEIRPFRIWSGLLRTALGQTEGIDLDTIVGADGPTLSRILPELTRKLDLPAPGPPADLEFERQALFGAVMRMIGRLSLIKPILIVLDDLHWADRSTLLLLSSLAGDNPPKGVLALGIYRDTELPPDSFLLETLVNLQRRRPTVRIKVGALETEEVGRLIRGRVSEDLAAALHDQTGGNPFYIEQLIRHFEETGSDDPSDVPAELRQIIIQRVAGLPEGAPDLLGRASLIGREFDVETLTAITPLDEDRGIELLDAAVASGLLDESASVPGRYSFVHALLRSTLDEELSLTRRSTVHRDIGEAIEKQSRTGPEQRLGELAWHFGNAGPAESDRAILYATRAAEQAEGRLAYDEALDFYEQAINACRADEPVDQGQLARLLISRANAEWQVGRLQCAGDTFFEAADAARLSGIPELLARAANGTCWGSWDAFDADRAEQIDLLEEALEAIGEGDGPLRAQLLANVAQGIYFGRGVTDRARRLAREAEEMVARIKPDPHTEFMVLASTSFVRWEPANLERRLAVTDRMVEMAERSTDPEDLAEGLAWRSVAYINLGRREEADADQARHAVLNKTLPQITVATAAMRAARCFLAGDWEEGERITTEALEEGIPQAAAIAMEDALHFMVRAQQGRLDEHLDRLREMSDTSAGWETWPTWRLGLLLAMAQAGDTEGVRAELDAIEYSGLDRVRTLNITYLSFCAVGAMLAAEIQDADGARKLAELLGPYQGEWVIIGPTGSCLGPVELLVGEMHLITGRDREAATCLERALKTCEEMASKPFLARSQLALAEALDRLGNPDGSDRPSRMRESGRMIAEGLGMKPVLSRYPQR